MIDRLGLHHHHAIKAGETCSFALMEYLARDVFDVAAQQGVAQPFALATVLECRNNPAFFPAPKGAATGFSVGLAAGKAREVLHMRIDYRNTHVLKLGQWQGRKTVPDLAAARRRHVDALRAATGRADFAAGVFAP